MRAELGVKFRLCRFYKSYIPFDQGLEPFFSSHLVISPIVKSWKSGLLRETVTSPMKFGNFFFFFFSTFCQFGSRRKQQGKTKKQNCDSYRGYMEELARGNRTCKDNRCERAHLANSKVINSQHTSDLVFVRYFNFSKFMFLVSSLLIFLFFFCLFPDLWQRPKSRNLKKVRDLPLPIDKDNLRQLLVARSSSVCVASCPVSGWKKKLWMPSQASFECCLRQP